MVRPVSRHHLYFHLHESEILDFGYPQTSEIDTLKAYITTEAARSEVTDVRLLPTYCALLKFYNRLAKAPSSLPK